METTEEKKPSKFIVLFRVVREMRIHQKSYFKTKNQADLINSMECEKMADKLIKEIEDEAREKGVQLG